jgi:uncharacterized protein (DUF885 family)
LILLVPLSIAGSKLEDNFKKMSGEILENLQSFYPVISTEKGIHTYDYLFTDYSKKSVKKEIGRLKKFETRIYKFNKSNLSPESRINLKLLKGNVDIALQNLSKIRWHRKNPYLYVNEAVNGIYLILISDYAPLNERAQNIIARLKGVPDLFKQAKKNIEKPPSVFVETAKEMLISGIDFYSSTETELASKFPELSTEIHTATERAIASMQDFQTFLGEIELGEPGSFAIGKKDFDYKLKHEYFLNYDSDSLLKLGEALFEEAQANYNEYLAGLDSSKSGNDSVFVLDCIKKEDILDYYNWEVAQTKLFLKENNIVTVPDDIGVCRVIETPSFLTNIISSIAYQPPGVFSPVQTGHFYVRPIPETMDTGQREARFKYIHRRGFKGSVVHEAYPGHHFQFQMASRVDDDVRKWQENSCFYEGWALYCEEMMYEKGFYGSNTRRYLNILGGILFRAARIVVDVKLHTGQMSLDEAAAWMADVLDSDTAWTRIEVNRYALNPTIQMSYLIGKLEILKLRDASKQKEGESFSLKEFHDKLLSEGSLPPHLLWEIWGLE